MGCHPYGGFRAFGSDGGMTARAAVVVTGGPTVSTGPSVLSTDGAEVSTSSATCCCAGVRRCRRRPATVVAAAARDHPEQTRQHKTGKPTSKLGRHVPASGGLTVRIVLIG